MKLLFTTFAIVLSLFSFSISANEKQAVYVNVTEKGFEPSILKVKKDTETVLIVTRKTNATCARDILIPIKNIKKELPLNKPVSISLGKMKNGDISFSCGMNMVTGVINVQ